MLKANLDQCIAGEVVKFDVKLELTSLGMIRDLSVSYYPYRDAENQISGVAVSLHDITARKRAAEALRESEERFRLAFDEAPIGMALVGLEHHFLRVNKSLCDMLGYSREELLKLTVSDITHPEDIEKSVELIEEAFRGKVPTYRLEKRYLTKAGDVIWVHLSATAVRDPEGNILYNLGTIEDISARKLAEQQQALLSSAVEQAAECIYITDAAGSIEYANPAFEKVTGYSPNEVIGKNTRLLSSGKHDRAFYNRLWETILRGATWRSTFVNRRKDGTLYEEHGSIAPVRDETGKITHFVAVRRDVSKEVELRKQLLQAQKLESLGVLAGGIAHDLNNTLTPIMGFTALVEESLPEGSPNRENLKEVLKSSERAKNLVRQILAFSRRGEQERKPVDIAGIVKGAMKFLRATIPPNIEIRQNIDPECGRVRADATQIEQVMMNLCTNACQALGDTGGRLEVSLTRVEVSSEDARAHSQLQGGPHVKLTVSDTGPGIDAAIVERVFEPFFTTKGVGEGTGLGLSIVHGIVTAHGGAISCRSEAGKGTSFFVYLPRLDEAADEKREHSEAPPNGAEHILFVDDEEPITRLAQQMLPALGYRVTVRTSGIEALEAFRAAPAGFDLVITDLAMPQLSGVDLARKLTEIRPDVPVLLCTGLREQIPRDGLHEIGIRGCVMKPFGMPDLAGIIRRTLDGQEPADV